MYCSVPPFSNFMCYYDAGVRLVTAIPFDAHVHSWLDYF